MDHQLDRTSNYEYDLPSELIAQHPVERGQSRLMVLDRTTGQVHLGTFADLPGHLREGDVLVVNDTRVSARRIAARLPSGRAAEALLLRRRNDTEWEALVYPGNRMRPGATLELMGSENRVVRAEVIERTPEGGRVLRCDDAEASEMLASAGTAPLPPYIREPLHDEDRYQTVYARCNGSAAAPTAGLHFTEEMLDRLAKRGVQVTRITLHVGVDTFRPVRDEDPSQHAMHGEWYSVGDDAADTINTRQGRVIAVGTTVVRTLESAANENGHVEAQAGITRLFIRPGYRFRVVGGMVTNFHLPRSTLLMLVSAFAGRETVLRAYRIAVEQRFRFYSFGDAMLIVGDATV